VQHGDIVVNVGQLHMNIPRIQYQEPCSGTDLFEFFLLLSHPRRLAQPTLSTYTAIMARIRHFSLPAILIQDS
jgi:hypothetical protein